MISLYKLQQLHDRRHLHESDNDSGASADVLALFLLSIFSLL